MSLKLYFVISLLFGFAFLLLAVLNYQQTSSYNGSRSDHFDGSHFLNSPPYHPHNFFDVIRWTFTASRSKWPAFIVNPSIPDLSPVVGDQVKVTYVNHSTMLIQTAHLNFLTDPIWTERASPIFWYGPKRVREPGVVFKNLPHIDLVLVSHNHYDHLSLPTLKMLSDRFHPIILVPLGLKNLLERHGIQNVVELDWWQTYSAKHVVITFLPTQHWSQRGLGDRYKTLWGSYGIVSGNKHIYFGGDSGYSPHFKEIRQQWGKPDLAFLPIGSYEPRWFMQENHMNPSEAVHAHHDLQSTHSIGIHFGTFQLSDEAIDQPLIDLKLAKANERLRADEFIALDVGQSLIY